MKKRCVVAALSALALFPLGLSANPIPLPVPASMPLEQMQIAIGTDKHVKFTGDFTFDFIPASVTKMLFPLPPVNASAIQVFEDGNPVPSTMSSSVYPTVLPEYPLLSMFEWNGPFPEDGAVFRVDYEHDLFQRGSDWIFFYSLGTGKYFPTYEKITTAMFQIDLPSGATLESVLLDDTPVDPRFYNLIGSRLDLKLTSEFGPFTQDLILVMRIPEPPSLGLLCAMLLAIGVMPGVRRLALIRQRLD
ncbi:MAG TPA: hypothetical protein VFB54_20140 [Burkholderiales bacterium]|nr:hypothetical protein [Burkholderiales bacterium]